MGTSSHELPDEIIIEILSRTTSKDLGRSNCVSKRWRDSFTIQAFKQRPFNSPDTVNRITVLDPRCTTRTLKMLSFETPRNYIKNDNKSLVIEGELWNLPTYLSEYSVCSNICHGLVCFYNTRLDFLSDSRIVLYSTRTNDMLVFPTTTNLDDLSTTVRVFCLTGFDTLRREYKIIRLTTNIMADRKQSVRLISYETQTLGSRSWNRIDNAKVPLSLSLGWVSEENGRGLYLDGSIFWVHIDQRKVGSSFRSKHSYTLAAFDLNNEEFRVFDLDSILHEFSLGLNVKCYVAEIRSCPTMLAFKYRDYCQYDMLVCAFSDCKMTSVACSRTVTRRGFVIGPWVSESRVIVQAMISHIVCRSGTLKNAVRYYCCEDLENDTSFEIVIKK